MYETMTYTGGVHKHYEMEELIEDLGGFILQKNASQLDITLTIAVPAEDTGKIKDKAKDLLGDVELSPLASTEIAVVSPTLARQHLPHAACDIAEYLRRYGTKTNMIGLARGAGKGISHGSFRRGACDSHLTGVLRIAFPAYDTARTAAVCLWKELYPL